LFHLELKVLIKPNTSSIPRDTVIAPGTFVFNYCFKDKKEGWYMSHQKNRDDLNPLRDLISDETYKLLESAGFLNQKSVRDHLIRKKFEMLKNERRNVLEAINIIQKEYPYLQTDTIRKIIYNIG
jgi:hypothetical protein